jgi:hypothetical protein
VVFFSVHIKGPTHEFRKKTVVLIKNKESVVFVQTDKPMYKPGQSGMNEVPGWLSSTDEVVSSLAWYPKGLGFWTSQGNLPFFQLSFELSLWIKVCGHCMSW